ncbi:hypothetical protein AB0G85_37975 [Streptomyces sioyaensis]|uniref:hypothetical protein n=1 Tax=Streptomyces sioyaensis TaxID=67364 RepID=UPI0033E26430
MGGSISGHVASSSAPTPSSGWGEFDLNEYSGHPGGRFNPNPSPRNGNYRLVFNVNSRNVYFTFDHYGHFYYLGRF